MIRLGLVGGFRSEETLDGSYRIDRIGWIVWIVSAGSYWLDCIGWIVWIVSAGLYWYRSWVC